MKRIIQSLFGVLGLEIRKKSKADSGAHYNEPMRSGLQRLKSLNLPINTIVDVGAAAGFWSLSASYFWPDSSFVLFEPLKERTSVLEELVKARPNFHYVPYAAGNADTTIQFAIASDLDGSGITEENSPDSRPVQVTSIQKQIGSLKLKGPFLIKLDTHGFEIPILEGCEMIMDQVAAFIIECYGFQIAKNSLLLYEMCDYMQKRGFRLWDIVDVMNRPVDGAFWQCDAFFIRESNAIFKHRSYNG